MQAACGAYSRPVVVEAVREVLDDARRLVASGAPLPAPSTLVASVLAHAETIAGGTLSPLINATGVIIHTNLGRAPLSADAIAAMAAVSGAYSNLEYDLATGERGSRNAHLEDLLRRLTGAEAGLAVNNNAAAVLLALTALAPEREVVIARGQLVEIGGGFRIPDVMRQSGARLVEVGTTNRSYAADYEAAITAQTALLLRVHPSNFRVIGFTHEASLSELVAVAARHDLPLMEDLGSGALLDAAAYGLGHEPLVQESVTAGAALICFSGDKLLGGPQAGIVVGRKVLVDRLKRHPLARAVRLDKASIAGLQATLLHYLRGEATAKIPVWQMIATPVEEIDRRALALAGRLQTLGIVAHVADARSTVGGGSLPGETLPTRVVAIGGNGATPATPSAQDLAARLRRQRPAVIGRIEHAAFLLDLRTVLPRQDETLAATLQRVLGEHGR